MKFSIQEAGRRKAIFLHLKKQAKKQGSLPKTLPEFSSQEETNIFEDAIKKPFWIQNEETTPFIQIDGEDFFTVEQIQERFGVSRTSLFNQLCRKKTHFLDSQEKSHEVTWKSDDLEKFLSLMKEAKMIGNVAPATFRGKRKADKKLCEKTLENILICNGIEGVF